MIARCEIALLVVKSNYQVCFDLVDKDWGCLCSIDWDDPDLID